MTLKEYMLKTPKEEVYKFYEKVVSFPKPYEKISRNDIYGAIIDTFIEDPEIILKMISIEEVHILKSLISENITSEPSGYIDYLLFQNLKNNFLILEDLGKKEYYIPKDLVNCIKMAINLYNEEIYSMKDITDSVLIGLVRAFNTLTLDNIISTLNTYHFVFSKQSLKDYIKTNPRLKELVGVIRYKKCDYIVSLENLIYKDILTIKKNDINPKVYLTEELISIGKYKINLFNKPVYDFLNYLESHLHPKYINQVIDELVIYMGIDMSDPKVLRLISDNIKELYEALENVIPHIPVWIYNGNDLASLKENKD